MKTGTKTKTKKETRPSEETSIPDIKTLGYNVKQYENSLSTYIKKLEGLETLEEKNGNDNKINDGFDFFSN